MAYLLSKGCLHYNTNSRGYGINYPRSEYFLRETEMQVGMRVSLVDQIVRCVDIVRRRKC